MRRILLTGLMVLGLAGGAQASTYVWEDPVNGFTFSFPDSWTVQTEDQPSTRIRIAGPLAEDLATCRVKAEKDGRLKIYPKDLMTQAVKETLDRDFWQGEIAEHDGAVITEYRAPAGMGGKGDATAIKHAFVQDKVDMYGAMIGSVYGDTRYVVSCASRASEYKKYAPVFASIMGSVDLDARYHPFAIGYYRDFLADPILILPRTKPGTVYEKNSFIPRIGKMFSK